MLCGSIEALRSTRLKNLLTCQKLECLKYKYQYGKYQTFNYRQVKRKISKKPVK